jgi:RimJ/RimL family protein N-acetyltransferase
VTPDVGEELFRVVRAADDDGPTAPPKVVTSRLTLTAPEAGDLEDWYRGIFADPEVMRFLPGGVPLPRERLDGAVERNRAHWAERGYGRWLVRDAGSGEFVGDCGLRFVEEVEEPEVLYAFARPWWGRGIATEAARASLRFGFEVAGLERIVAFAVPENVASRRVLERCGMRLEGELDIFDIRCVEYAISKAQSEEGPPARRSDGPAGLAPD